jgi:hypothetical protein
MIDAKQIPDEVMEAAVTAWLEKASDYTRLNESIRAAIAAALAAWPGAGIVATEDHTGRYPQIILPLPQEPRT